jgi:hypothetical protein
MSSAELNKKKLDLIAWINQLSDVNLISFLDGLKNSRAAKDWWNELPETEQKLVLKGLEDAEQGNIVPSAEFWNSIKNA